MSLTFKEIYALMESLRQRRMTLLAAGAGDSTDWKALFTGLIDRTIAGDIVIPNTLSGTSIAAYIFQNCAGVTSITLPPQVTTIDANAFEKCSNVERIVKSDGSGITVVNGRCFGDCKKLVEIPPFAEGMTAVPNWCFIGCSALTHIELPSTITQIKGQAFYGCGSLRYILIKATTPPTLDAVALPAELGSIFVPDTSVDAYKAATRWSDVAAKIRPISTAENVAITTQSNPEVMEICNANGLCTSSTQMLVKECVATNNVKNNPIFANSDIVHFEEFAYFDMSNRFTSGTGPFAGCELLERIVFPKTFTACSNGGVFFGCTAKPVVVLTSDSMVTLDNDSARDNFKNYTSAIYVPDSLVSTYNANARWATMSAKIFPISEYTFQNLDVKTYLGL